MLQICVRRAVSGVSTTSGTDDVVRDATEARELRVVLDCFEGAVVDDFADRADDRGAILVDLGIP